MSVERVPDTAGEAAGGRRGDWRSGLRRKVGLNDRTVDRRPDWSSDIEAFGHRRARPPIDLEPYCRIEPDARVEQCRRCGSADRAGGMCRQCGLRWRPPNGPWENLRLDPRAARRYAAEGARPDTDGQTGNDVAGGPRADERGEAGRS